MEEAHGVRAAADAGDQHVGQPALGLLHLLARFLADDRLEVAHHRRIGVRARHRADAVERVADVRDPVAQRLVHRVLERAAARGHRHDLGAEQAHAEDVRALALDIRLAHEDDALQPELGADGRGGDAVLAGAGFGDDPGLAHAAGQQDLAEHVVDLVRARVVQLVALEVDLGAAELLGQARREIERARPADIVLPEVVHLGPEGRVLLGPGVFRLELEDQRHQRLGDEAAAELAEPAALVGAGAIGIEHLGRHGRLPRLARES